ncbi:hypothetical protein KP509_19G022400 [Ceratopteris richardii]|uniref:F-box protein n=1 Tax=Ceratopteris richardii TaxID=49495 RepID=A0A8T2SKD2_CERRI|nr:hypothetical protein KP509_19G022400 [Ceratopteris richardii]
MSGTFESLPPFSVWLALALVLIMLIVKARSKIREKPMMRAGRELKFETNAGTSCENVPAASFLDLSELVMDNLLSKLSPQALSKAASVCKELRQRCTSDHVWLPRVLAKWGGVAGDLAFEEWMNDCISLYAHNPYKLDDSSFDYKSRKSWPLSRIWTPREIPPLPQKNDECNQNVYMKWYIALETGNYCFRGQVYNREHGHVGFLMSCYDAEVCYDRESDTFKARYPPHGTCSPVLEEGVSWERLRKPPVSTTAQEVYVSPSLRNLRPGDHVEVQWRAEKTYPYGWWYGVVGHSEACSKDMRRCVCHLDDTVWLEFNQYAPGSRWRRTEVNRDNHTEKGDDTEGYYAGVRKLSKDEVSVWTRFWPKELLE